MSDRLVVAGGTIAALVAADAAAAAGCRVTLLLPRRGVGGGFAPLTVGAHRLDRGLRALELRYEGVGDPPPLAAYDPAGAGHRPYARLIEAYVAALVGEDLVELDVPQLWFGGRTGEDLVTTCDLSGLRAHLDTAQASRILEDVRGRGAGLLDPRRAAELPSTPVTEASREQHGALLHELLIAPLAAKLRAAAGDDVPATLRRKLWLPLFHPQTVEEALGGGPLSFRPERPFHTVARGGTGAILTRLLERLRASPRVDIVPVDGFGAVHAVGGDRVEIVVAGGAPVTACAPVLALAPGELLATTGVTYEPDRVTSVLTWLHVADADAPSLPSFVHVADADVPVFRFSRGEQRDGRTVVCAELAHDVPKEDAAAVATQALVRLGLLRDGAPAPALASFAGPTFTAPTFANAERFAAARAAYDALEIPTIAIGGIEAFGADSLNEQLVQGLRAAESVAGAAPVAAGPP